MGKVVSATEFDVRFARLIDELAEDGEPVTIMRDGEVVATLVTPSPRKVVASRSVIGMLRSPDYRSDWDHEAPAIDPDDWTALHDDPAREP